MSFDLQEEIGIYGDLFRVPQKPVTYSAAKHTKFMRAACGAAATGLDYAAQGLLAVGGAQFVYGDMVGSRDLRKVGGFAALAGLGALALSLAAQRFGERYGL